MILPRNAKEIMEVTTSMIDQARTRDRAFSSKIYLDFECTNLFSSNDNLS